MNDRYTADTINDDALTALYERVATAEQEAEDSVAAAARLTTLVGKRSERAERDAEKQRRRADIAETELRTLRAGLRANGADPTQLQNLWAQISLRNRQWRETKRELRLTRSMLDEEGGDVSLVDEMISTVGAAEAKEREAQAAIERVRALHQPDPDGRSGYQPDDDDTPGAYGDIAQACKECGSSDLAVRWPCPTILALDDVPA